MIYILKKVIIKTNQPTNQPKKKGEVCEALHQYIKKNYYHNDTPK